MNIAVIKYNAGNVSSVLYALQRLGVHAAVTEDHEEIGAADKVIFPGVGHAGAAMRSLQQNQLDKLIPKLTQPVLGICIGLQLMCTHSEEGDTPCLGIVPLKVKEFAPAPGLKIPQIGWNSITGLQGPLFDGVEENSYVYYVHSYYAALGDATIATSDYGYPYSAGIRKDNFFGVQFHTEKSSGTGDKILANFLKL